MTIHRFYILTFVNHVQSNLHLDTTSYQVHQHNTSQKVKTNIPYCRLSKTKDSLPVMALQTSNNPPGKTKSLDRNFIVRCGCEDQVEDLIFLRKYVEYYCVGHEHQNTNPPSLPNSLFHSQKFMYLVDNIRFFLSSIQYKLFGASNPEIHWFQAKEEVIGYTLLYKASLNKLTCWSNRNRLLIPSLLAVRFSLKH